MPRVIHERIPLREWLSHMSFFHANVQIRNDSARTLYITMIVVPALDADEGGDSPSPADRCAALVPPHTLEPGYAHLYSIPQPPHQHWRGGAAARVTLAFRDNDDGDDDDAVCQLLLRSGDRLRVAS
jgi:hypothetical protein